MEQAAPEVDVKGIETFVAQQREVVAVYLFGSVARGRATHLSDVDIAVLLDPNLGQEARVERQLELMVALDDFADREVQVTVLNDVPPALAYRVIREGRLIYEGDRRRRIAFEVRTMKIYFDIKPMLQFHGEVLLEQIQEVGLDRRATKHSRTLGTAQRIRDRPAGTAEG